MTSPFDYLNSITDTKVDMQVEASNDSMYPAFIINKGLAQHLDTIMYASELNTMTNITSEMHYAYCYAAIGKKKRYGKWVKMPEMDDNVKFLSKHYNINITEALEYSKILKSDDIEKLKSMYDEVTT